MKRLAFDVFVYWPLTAAAAAAWTFSSLTLMAWDWAHEKRRDDISEPRS